MTLNRFGRHRVARIRGLSEPGLVADSAEEVVGLVTAFDVDRATGDLLMEIDLETPGQAAERVLADQDRAEGC
jgi:hypothetical protein